MKIKEILTEDKIKEIKDNLLKGGDLVQLLQSEGITDRMKIRFVRSYLIKKYSLKIKRIDNKNYWTDEELTELIIYLEKGKSYEELTELFKNRHSNESIKGIIRTKKLKYKGNKRRMIDIQEENEIVEKIKSGKYSSCLLVEEYKISPDQVSNISKKHNLIVPTDVEAGVVRNNSGKIVTGIDKETIERLVLNSTKPLKQIAKDLDISKDTLARRMSFFKIKRPKNNNDKKIGYVKRKITEIIKILYNRKPTTEELKLKSFRGVLNKDTLEQLYVQFNKDVLELSKYLNISKAIINKLINLYKIKRNEQPRFSDYPLDYYKKLFFDKNLTFDEIAELVGLRKETVRKKMTKLIPETKNLNGFSSRGEIQTDRILKELKLDYSYNKCYYLDPDDPHKKFFIDFVITFNDKVFWIEYNGKQHYQYIPYFYAESKEEWILQLKRDKIVREYSKENDITLLEIPYTCATSSEIKELIVSAIFNHDMSNIISFADFFSEETKQIYKTI